MKALISLTLLFLSLLLSNNAYAEEPMVMEQVTPNGKIKVQLTWPEVLPGQLYNIGIKFLDANTDQLLDKVAITYDVIVLQQGATIEIYKKQNTSTGEATFEVVFPQDGAGSAEVIVAVTSMTDNSGTVDMDETVSFNVQVVPEFATLAVMVTGFSIAIVLAINRFKNQLRNYFPTCFSYLLRTLKIGFLRIGFSHSIANVCVCPT